MQYAITFLEGITAFISPCMLPMLPVYISYFSGGAGEKKKTLLNAAAFTAGFTVVFCLMGLFAGTLGSFLVKYRTAVNIVCGAVVVLFGLSYLGVIRIPFFKGMQGEREIKNAFSAFVFGLVYSVSLTPCIGAFLGSALMMASASGTALKGLILLFVYSLGLGLPFMISAVLIDRLENVFNAIKAHYKIINLVAGILLIVIGVLMATGLWSRLLALMS